MSSKITIKIKRKPNTDETQTDQSYINQIMAIDCIEGMKTLPDEVADIIICDPPYNIGKDIRHTIHTHKQ
jgi:DNA modification methylase